MTTLPEQAQRDAILARLATTRAELRALLEPRPQSQATGGDPLLGGFIPRSRTMRMLLSGRGVGAVAAIVGGLLLTRPGVVWRLLRALPSSAIVRVVALRIIRSLAEPRRKP